MIRSPTLSGPDLPSSIFRSSATISICRWSANWTSKRHGVTTSIISPNGALKGGTSNPKLAFTWLLDELTGATIRGTWGTSFRFANAGEYSVVLSDQNVATNLPGAPDRRDKLRRCGADAPVARRPSLFAAGFRLQSTRRAAILWSGGPHAALRELHHAQGASHDA